MKSLYEALVLDLILCCSGTYTVVALSVKVRLVDSILNSHVGRVIVVKVISQKSSIGIALTTNSTA